MRLGLQVTRNLVRRHTITTELDSRTSPRTESQSETVLQAPTESSENYKLMIRVAHRPSKQESKFTTKSTTKVHKVLTGVCKSFGFDASQYVAPVVRY